MVKTRKNITKKNVSRKNVLSTNDLKLCPIGLEPFEEEFSKTFSKYELN